MLLCTMKHCLKKRETSRAKCRYGVRSVDSQQEVWNHQHVSAIHTALCMHLSQQDVETAKQGNSIGIMLSSLSHACSVMQWLSTSPLAYKQWADN